VIRAQQLQQLESCLLADLAAIEAAVEGLDGLSVCPCTGARKRSWRDPASLSGRTIIRLDRTAVIKPNAVFFKVKFRESTTLALVTPKLGTHQHITATPVEFRQPPFEHRAVRARDHATVIRELNRFVLPYIAIRNRGRQLCRLRHQGGLKAIGRNRGPVRPPTASKALRGNVRRLLLVVSSEPIRCSSFQPSTRRTPTRRLKQPSAVI